MSTHPSPPPTLSQEDDDFGFPLPPPDPAKANRTADELVAELQEHPFFMTKMPDNLEDNKYAKALQEMLYEGTPDEIAANFKEQGNEAFRLGKKGYSDAVSFYSKGIAANPTDAELVSTLYANRAAVNLELGNFRSTLGDCAKAIKANAKNVKAYYRAAKASLALDHVDDALDAAKRGLQLDPSNQPLETLNNAIVSKKEELLLAKARHAERERAERVHQELLERTIRDRGIVVRESPSRSSSTNLPSAELPRPTIDTTTKPATLHFPILLLYPEYHQTDLVQSAAENDPVLEHLREVLAEPPSWDTQNSYNYLSVDLWYELPIGSMGSENEVDSDPTRTRVVRISDKGRTLGQILRERGFVVWDGVVRLLVLPKKGKFTVSFLKRYKERKI
ncbi:hypothetical protein HDU93_000097 [Gonapodya sp. JEL0774]|nr:hypothetical protein HDU93_000097 [Gonapodya sp. JEL0774]